MPSQAASGFRRVLRQPEAGVKLAELGGHYYQAENGLLRLTESPRTNEAPDGISNVLFTVYCLGEVDDVLTTTRAVLRIVDEAALQIWFCLQTQKIFSVLLDCCLGPFRYTAVHWCLIVMRFPQV